MEFYICVDISGGSPTPALIVGGYYDKSKDCFHVTDTRAQKAASLQRELLFIQEYVKEVYDDQQYSSMPKTLVVLTSLGPFMEQWCTRIKDGHPSLQIYKQGTTVGLSITRRFKENAIALHKTMYRAGKIESSMDTAGFDQDVAYLVAIAKE